jgi:hypothetical protein
MALKFSRRSTLAISAGVAVGVLFWSRTGPEKFIAKILDRRFPGVRIETGSITTLTRDIELDRFQTFFGKFAFHGGARAANVVGTDALARWRLTAEQFSHLERKVVTFFVLGSNLLDVQDPTSDLVIYSSVPEACVNRFAERDVD